MVKVRQLYRIILMAAFFLLPFNIFAYSIADNRTKNPLRWKTQTIPIAVSSSLLKDNPNIKPDSDVKNAVRRSLLKWETAANIKFEVVWSDKQTISPKGRIGDGVSLLTIAQTPENLILFSQNPEENPAQTRVFYNKKGFITEADIVLNPYQQFSTDGSIGTYDLETTISHEIGHLLGLEHSPVLGALMYAHYAKNNSFSVNRNYNKQLDLSDVTALRSLYGANSEDEDCCGSISGKIIYENTSTTGKIVWAENAETGQIVAQTVIAGDGNYLMNGLSPGKYRVFCQTNSKTLLAVKAIDFGTAEVRKNKETTVTKNAEIDVKNPIFDYLGINSELSNISVNAAPGTSLTLYIGGKLTDFNKLKFGFDTGNIKITSQNLIPQNFGDNITAITFNISVADETPGGSYSFYIESEKGQREYFIGAVNISTNN